MTGARIQVAAAKGVVSLSVHRVGTLMSPTEALRLAETLRRFAALAQEPTR